MALNDSALVVMATALDVTHLQLHSTDPGVTGATAAVGSRVAATKSVDADGDITWSNVAFTGLTANQAVAAVSYWTAITGGLCRGRSLLTGDAAANAAGAYTVTSIAENSTAS